MDTREAVANRIKQLCKERNIMPNAIGKIAAVPQATIKSILNGESKILELSLLKNFVTDLKSL